MADKLTEAELAQLTDEEREGLLEEEDDAGDADDDSDDDAGAGEASGETGNSGAPAAGTDKSDELPDSADITATAAADGDDAGGEAAGKADPAGAPAQGMPAANDKPVVEPERTPTWVLPADYDEKVATLKTQRQELDAKFDDGDIFAKEYREQLQALDEQHEHLRELKIKASVAHDTAKQTFVDGVSSFLSQHQQYEKGSVLYGLLDAEVRKLQGNAVNPLNPKLVEQAHANISAELAKAFGTPVAQKPTAEAKKAAPKRPDPPPTLGGVPAADIDDTGDGGEFAALERLMNTDSVAYERELSRLSPEARDRFLSM